MLIIPTFYLYLLFQQYLGTQMLLSTSYLRSTYPRSRKMCIIQKPIERRWFNTRFRLCKDSLQNMQRRRQRRTTLRRYQKHVRQLLLQHVGPKIRAFIFRPNPIHKSENQSRRQWVCFQPGDVLLWFPTGDGENGNA